MKIFSYPLQKRTERGAISNFLLDSQFDKKFGKNVLIKKQNHTQDTRKKGEGSYFNFLFFIFFWIVGSTQNLECMVKFINRV